MRKSLVLFSIFGGHQQIGQPQGQAIDHGQRLRLAVTAQRLGKLQGFFNRAQFGNPDGAIRLVARNPFAHFLVPRLGRGNQHRAVRWRPGQPSTRQHFCAARLAAGLAAQDQLAAGDGQFVSHIDDPSPE